MTTTTKIALSILALIAPLALAACDDSSTTTGAGSDATQTQQGQTQPETEPSAGTQDPAQPATGSTTTTQ